MGENPASKRNYKREYELWKKRPHAMDIQYDRVKARRAMVKEYGKAALEGKDIDHIVPLSRPVHRRRAIQLAGVQRTR